MKIETIPDIPDREELNRSRARCRHLEFMKYCWIRKEPMLVGIHTETICKRIDVAIDNFRNGISTFLIVLVCFRQGKSEIVSRYLPAHFMGEFPDLEIILGSHSTNLAEEFGRFSRGVIRDERFQELYPHVQISKEKSGVGKWGIEGTQGLAQFFGIRSGSAGRGGSLIIIDDYFGKREDAESEVIREKTWISFKDDYFSRRADPCIFLFTVTPWHVDDLVGRIQKEMKENPAYPKFDILKFPAKSDKYETGYLFPQKYSPQWYIDQATVLGPYSEASLMQCEPQLKSGNMLKVDKIKFYDDDSELPEGLVWSRGWDLASSEKQVIKSDPDYTFGVKIGVLWIKSTIPGHDIPIIYIDDAVYGRWEALQRNRVITSATIADGFIKCGIEAFGPYKDAYTTLVGILSGIRNVVKMQLPGDKVAKASVLEPAFQAGNVYMRRGAWNEMLLKHIREFPSGSHDDGVDGLVVAYELAKTTGVMIYTEADYQLAESKREELTKIINARLPTREQMGCTLDEYTDFVRELLIEKKENTELEDYKRYIQSEINRLDHALGWDEHVEGVV